MADAAMDNYIKFLGTAGARFVMITQLRASGGLWFSYQGTNLLIDPGPGSIVRCAMSKPKMDPAKLDGILLTHRHLDHSNDLNVMIEAMTEGGFKKRGVVFLPYDIEDEEQLILKHLRQVIGRIEVLKAEIRYKLGAIEFSVPSRQKHSVPTYGLKFYFKANNKEFTLSLIADTRYFEGIEDLYKADVVIINVVFYEPRPEVDHLCLEDARKIILGIGPKTAVLTHFGMSMVKRKPRLLAENLSKELGINVLAASDGMKFSLDNALT